ncbi:MAG TPA: relaxase/mobilization nuclease domain-containing protein, partial [Mucilaginibacter sp.]|nr:relaxase/mobilization nuclease domain-containing protein [Mucilaginibacter sp.]
EVLEYNLCFGDKLDLYGQFKDVRLLNRKVEKPVFHLAFRPAPGDKLSNEQWREVAQAAAKEFQFEHNQYVCILHKDTQQHHIHIVANRIGYDGKTVSDSNSYRRIAELCRRMEKQYELQQVLSPRQFLSAKERQIPRHDQIKEQLREGIRQSLKGTRTYREFERKIQDKGYQVDKGRGIAFEDEKKVRIKGSEVGYSLAIIEQTLAKNQQASLRKMTEYWQKREKQTRLARDKVAAGIGHRSTQVKTRQIKKSAHKTNGQVIGRMIKIAFEPVKGTGGGSSFDPWEEEERRRRKKKKRLRH